MYASCIIISQAKNVKKVSEYCHQRCFCLKNTITWNYNRVMNKNQPIHNNKQNKQ